MTDTGHARPNTAQRKYWSSRAGRKWITFEGDLDQLLSRVNDRLLRHADPAPDETVLDVGCGTGATARCFAERLDGGGRVLAVDIAAPLVKHAACTGQGRIDWLHADAQGHDFDEDRFDLVVSRFGTMFFNDPIAAFANIYRAMRSGGRLHLACWRDPSENPWFRIPLRAVQRHFGPVAPPDSHAPGPVAFADEERVVAILEQAGFSEVTAARETVGLIHPGPLPVLARLAASLGPVEEIMIEKCGTAADLERIEAMIATAFRRYVTPHGVHIPASLNFYSARRD